MKKKSNDTLWQKAIRQDAFTLIEMVGVLAVLAVLAAVLLPALIKETDKVVSDQESATLQSFGTALQNSILRNRSIPDNTTWLSVVATEMGMNSSLVATNGRQQPRVFLIDTNGFNPMILPYAQSSTGTNLPPSPRFMIVSSLGQALPGALINKPGTTIFNDIWNTSPGNKPTNSMWSSWSRTDDLLIQRINLSPLFVHLILTTNNSTANWAAYSIDSGSTTNSTNFVTPAGINAYFIQNSVLDLFTTNTVTLDSRQILTRDTSFVYDQNVWRTTIMSISPNSIPPDYSGIVNAFTNTVLPSGVSTTNTPGVVATDFVNYMNAYNAWANSGFASANKAAAIAAYNTMMAHVNGLVSAVAP